MFFTINEFEKAYSRYKHGLCDRVSTCTHSNLVHSKFYSDRVDHIRPVIVLSNTLYQKMGHISGRYTFINNAIVGDEYYLYDVNTIKKFNLKITQEYIHEISKRGLINVLDWLKKNGLLIEYDNTAIDIASTCGHINVLEWWKNSGLPLKYSEKALDDASYSGRLNVLEWWKNSGLPLKYSEKAINDAYLGGLEYILEWWIKSRLPLKYSHKQIHKMIKKIEDEYYADCFDLDLS
jgi:hypothetical protein